MSDPYCAWCDHKHEDAARNPEPIPAVSHDARPGERANSGGGSEPIPDTPSLREAADLRRALSLLVGAAELAAPDSEDTVEGTALLAAIANARAALDPEAEAERNFSTRSIKG